MMLAAAGVNGNRSSLSGGSHQNPNDGKRDDALLKDRVSLILVAIFGVTVGPLAEELIFRGFLQPLLVRSLGTAAGISVTAIPFGMLHYWQYGRSWRHVIMIGAAGAAFGWVKQSTGSTKASTIMHASYNAVLFAGLFLQQRS